ncbi:hypothetical protein C446_05640 [Halobiforma nitratireducens JCM 10879]|uniref:Uncharacterized protein n=1 Tax=Halobiforma nitratireducens JCM 10879 TaxID=1227454 RepID=M0M8U9_9EURY|nr:hypothetical protein C446_05640 [Halobiforma nitratireducens JCM 10879]
MEGDGLEASGELDELPLGIGGIREVAVLQSEDGVSDRPAGNDAVVREDDERSSDENPPDVPPDTAPDLSQGSDRIPFGVSADDELSEMCIRDRGSRPAVRGWCI